MQSHLSISPNGIGISLLQCLKKHNITSFQLERNLYQPRPFMKKVLKVYCLCRLPECGDSMILCQTCREWFHYTCVAIRKAPKGPYNCSKCSCYVSSSSTSQPLLIKSLFIPPHIYSFQCNHLKKL